MKLYSRPRTSKQFPLRSKLENTFRLGDREICCAEYGNHENDTVIILDFSSNDLMESKFHISRYLQNQKHVVYAKVSQENALDKADAICRRVRTESKLPVCFINFHKELKKEIQTKLMFQIISITEPQKGNPEEEPSFGILEIA